MAKTEYAMVQPFFGLLLLVVYLAYLFARAPNEAVPTNTKKPFVYDPDYVAAFLKREQRRFQSMTEAREAAIREGIWTNGEEDLYQEFFGFKIDYEGPMYDGDPMYASAARHER